MRRIDRVIIIALGLVIFMPMLAFAGGGREIITETADGIDIWQQDFDVTGLKKGTYNVLITAKDAAGNEGISGPYNIKIDPMAGLPEARVVYPEQGNIIRGDLNIVGVASGRYGIDRISVKLDNGEYRNLEGNEYWSLSIPADDMSEGKHTLYVKASDTNDRDEIREGPVFKVDFVMDLFDPAFELISHEIGDLIAGNVKIKGRVIDYNGLQSLYISTDDGATFKSLSHTAGKRGDVARYFQFSIPSKKYSDGPLVYHLRAVNKNGYAVTRPFLFFVNNYPPEIEILSPAPDETVFGPTQVTGRVHSPVGLERFYYEWDGQQFDIPIRPGDPFWAVTFPISLATNRAIPFRVTAVDKSGNVTTKEQRFRDTRQYRTPTLVIDYPKPAAGLGRMQLEPDQPIYGHIVDGFIAQNIVIDGVIDYVWARPSFRIPPEMIPAGNNTMRIWAMDETDVMGQPGVALRISKRAPADGFEIARSPITIYGPHEQVSYFDPEIWNDTADPHPWVEDSVNISGFIDDYRSGHRLEYRFRWDDTWKPISVGSSGEFDTTISLAGFAEEYIPLELRTVRDGQGDFPLYLPVNKHTTKPSISFLTPDERFGVVQRATTASGIVKYHVPLESLSFSQDGIYFEEIEHTVKAGMASFHRLFDFTAMHNDRQTLTIRAVDRAGNVVEASPKMVFNNSEAVPRIIHNAPLNGDLITANFEVSGLAYVDVGIAAIFWRVIPPRNPWDSFETTWARRNQVEWERFDTARNYNIPLMLEDARDGENILEIFAEDIYGIQGEVTRCSFNVSTAIPETMVTEPAMELWSRKNVMVKGTAFDRNGIKEILVSMDNGVSYQRADFVSSQTEPSEWSISLNTQAYTDDIYSMLIRAVDNYGLNSFTSAIINIDNTPPTIDLGSPGNGSRFGGVLPINGQVFDNLNIDRISIQLVNINNPREQESYDLENSFIIQYPMDISVFTDGDYTLTVKAADLSGNETTVIRNISIMKAKAASEVAIINPLPGIAHSGPLVVSGRVTGAVIPEEVTLMLDGRAFAKAAVDRYGVFRYEMPEETINADKSVVFAASFGTPGGETIVSYDSMVKLSSYGPVLIIDSHHDGEIITKRPYLKGRAFITVPGADETPLTKIQRAALAVEAVGISLDNGRTFSLADGLETWQFRLETSEMENGTLPVVVRALFANGQVAIRRILLTVDTRAPSVVTIGPSENSAHRDVVSVYGSVTDDFDIDSVEVSLRPGDKAGYSVPEFIQGLYLDGMALGGMNWSAGIGLTFFDDNVKLQVQVAQAPPGRYEGMALGLKILANVWTQNLGQWFGPDWEFWQTSVTLGAHFSYFLMNPNAEPPEDPLWMGRFLGQWEIIKADMGFFFPKWKYFKSISLYMEPGIWFAPSDVSNNENAWRVMFNIGFGGRISLF